MTTNYYKTCTHKLTFAELWQLSGSLWQFVLAVSLKICRWPIQMNFALGWNGQLVRKTWEEIPEHARQQLRPIARQCKALGIHRGFFYSLPMVGGMETYCMALRSESEPIVVTAVYNRHWTGATIIEKIMCLCTSGLSNGQVIVTTGSKKELNSPQEFDVAYYPTRTLPELMAAHRVRLAVVPAQPLLIRDYYALERFITNNEQRSIQFQIDRGLFTPIAEAEIQYCKAYQIPHTNVDGVLPAHGAPHATNDYSIVAELADAHGQQSRHPAVMVEINRLQNKAPGWGLALVILGVSVALFMGLGAAWWSWDFILLLLPILFFHEMGHYVAMRLFKYRNLKMFFIPLFGAAVSGTHYNVPGWKKAIVSLAGPLPGIVLAILIGILAIQFEQKLLFQVALLMLILNGFNLLPFVPLDGGWVLHTILFSRHHVLDVGFRAFAILALIGLGLITLSPFLAMFGVFMSFGLPAIYRMARITDELRDSGLPAGSADGQTVPIETADVIIDRIEAAFPKGLNHKMKAQFTLQIFESLNARPPGVLPTLGFAGLHGGSFAVAVIFTVILVQFGPANIVAGTQPIQTQSRNDHSPSSSLDESSAEPSLGPSANSILSNSSSNSRPASASSNSTSSISSKTLLGSSATFLSGVFVFFAGAAFFFFASAVG